MTIEAFTQAMTLIIFCSFIVERSLAVLFETEFFIQKLGQGKHIRPAIAIIYAMFFVAIVDVNMASVIRTGENAGYTWLSNPTASLWNFAVITVTGIFIAGGSKASLKLFRDVLGIQSSYAAKVRGPVPTAPADPPQASLEAAKGNDKAKDLLFSMLDNSHLKKK